MRKSEDYTPPTVPAGSFGRKSQQNAAGEADKAAAEEEKRADKAEDSDDDSESDRDSDDRAGEPDEADLGNLR